MKSTCPLSDAASNGPNSHEELRKLSVKLERELTAAQAEIAELRAKCEKLEKKRAYWKSIAKASKEEWEMEEAESEEG